MALRIELHDSVVGSVRPSNGWLEIHFDEFVIIDIKDHFGFEFETMPSKKGVVRLKNPKFESLPTEGPVSDGRIGLGDLSYDNLLPLDLNISKPCFLYFSQASVEHLIFADELVIILLN